MRIATGITVIVLVLQVALLDGKEINIVMKDVTMLIVTGIMETVTIILLLPLLETVFVTLFLALMDGSVITIVMQDVTMLIANTMEVIVIPLNHLISVHSNLLLITLIIHLI
jgi:hypothetical protein